ncbi:MAG: 16S rRNA (cytosine(967)-C(5))-methyltransferase RsmB [Candidatus Neomarinimicrobiota bacterium]
MARKEPDVTAVADQARLTAYRVLSAADRGAKVNEALQRSLAGTTHGTRDRRFITDLVMGTTRMRARLDRDLAACYRGRYTGIEARVKRLLRLGAYQLLFMDRVPAHAALNTTVELARAVQRARAAGLVNGVLRQLSRQSATESPAADASPQALAAAYSHPEWMVRRWLDVWGREKTGALMEWNNRRPTVWLRPRQDEAARHKLTEMATAEGVKLRSHPLMSDYVAASPSPAPLLTAEVINAGLFIVQDPSSGAVLQVVDPQPGEVIIDLCAGPGGKTAALAERVGAEGRVLAYEIDPQRVELLRETVSRMGLGNVDIFPGDATAAPLPLADKVLLDVPCTGTGVIARRADLRWRRRPEDLGDLTKLQASLLKHAARNLRPGGVLIYATCSLEAEENRELVEEFLSKEAGFSLAVLPRGIPRAWCDNDGALATFPPEHEVDGMFAVRLESKAVEQGGVR